MRGERAGRPDRLSREARPRGRASSRLPLSMSSGYLSDHRRRGCRRRSGSAHTGADPSAVNLSGTCTLRIRETQDRRCGTSCELCRHEPLRATRVPPWISLTLVHVEHPADPVIARPPRRPLPPRRRAPLRVWPPTPMGAYGRGGTGVEAVVFDWEGSGFRWCGQPRLAAPVPRAGRLRPGNAGTRGAENYRSRSPRPRTNAPAH